MKTTFVIGPNAPNLKPGKAKHEELLLANAKAFKDLHAVKNWRRVLDDSFVYNIIVDGKMWPSVNHYKYAQFFKDNKDYMTKFEVGGVFESKDSKYLLKVLESKTGTVEKEKVRPKDIIPIFPKNLSNITNKAIHAKFSSSDVLLNILCATRDATLTKVSSKDEISLCQELMAVRDTLCKPSKISPKNVVYSAPKKTKSPKKLGGGRGPHPEGFNQEIIAAVEARKQRLIPKQKKEILKKTKKNNQPKAKAQSAKAQSAKIKSPMVHLGTVLGNKPHPPMIVVKNPKKINEPLSHKYREPDKSQIKILEKEYNAAKLIADSLTRRYKKQASLKNKERKNKVLKEQLALSKRKANEKLAILKIQKALIDFKAKKDKKAKEARLKSLLNKKGVNDRVSLHIINKLMDNDKPIVVPPRKAIKPSFKKGMMVAKRKKQIVEPPVYFKWDVNPLGDVKLNMRGSKDLLNKKPLLKSSRIQDAPAIPSTKAEKIRQMKAASARRSNTEREIESRKHEYETHFHRGACPYCKKIVIPEDISEAPKSRYLVYVCKNKKCPKIGAVLGDDEMRPESYAVTGKRSSIEHEFTGEA